jgi:hypothetical protein
MPMNVHLASYESGASPTLDSRGVDAGGDCAGGTDGKASARGADDKGADTTRVSAGREWHRPNQGHAYSGGSGRY